MKKYWMISLLFLPLIFSCTTTSSSLKQREEDGTKAFIAFSLDVAEAQIKGRQEKGKDFRKTLPEVYHLGYMTRPLGLIFDPLSADTIIIGEKANASNLVLDDFASALRSIYLYGLYPQITIDPEGDIQEAQWHQVRLSRGIENSHLAKVLFESDYLLKKISLNLVRIKVPGFKSQYRLMREKRRRGVIYSRFWFKPTGVDILLSKNAVFINRYPICILTETFHQDIKDETALKFAESFSARFDEFAQEMPVFEDLKNILRWVGIVSSIPSLDFSPHLKFWLLDYQIQTFKIPERIKGLSNVYADLNIILKVYGGVDSNYLSLVLKEKDIAALADLANLVINSRPAKDTLAWGFYPHEK